MGSGNDYERVFKLWVSLWKLVLEEKRHIEAVCAVLQKLIFDKTSYPTHKNWPAICKVAKQSHGLMVVIAGLTDYQMQTDFGRRFITMFPECFSEEPIGRPIPWSLIVELAHGNARIEACGHFDESCHVVCFNGVQTFNIPVINYTASEKSRLNYPDYPVWPLTESNLSVKDRVVLDDQDWDVVQVWGDGIEKEIAVVPAGSINFNA